MRLGRIRVNQQIEVKGTGGSKKSNLSRKQQFYRIIRFFFNFLIVSRFVEVRVLTWGSSASATIDLGKVQEQYRNWLRWSR